MLDVGERNGNYADFVCFLNIIVRHANEIIQTEAGKNSFATLVSFERQK